MTLASSSASDTAVVIRVVGLGADFVLQSEDVTLNGTTGVPTVGLFLRINRLETVSGNAVGNVTAVNNGVTYAKINAGNGVTQMSIFTVPAGYTFYQTYYQADTNTSVTGGSYIKLRTYTVHNELPGPVITAELQSAFVQQLQVPLQYPVQFTEKHDIQYQMIGSGGAGAVANIYVGGVLIKNNI
jgi:PKD repeat protein